MKFLFSVFITLLFLNSALCQDPSSDWCSDMDLWEKAYIFNGTFTCSDWTIDQEDFNSESEFHNNWNTLWHGEDHRYARSFNMCDETLWLSENIEIDEINGKCIIHGKREVGKSWTNTMGETFTRDYTLE